MYLCWGAARMFGENVPQQRHGQKLPVTPMQLQSARGFETLFSEKIQEAVLQAVCCCFPNQLL